MLTPDNMYVNLCRKGHDKSRRRRDDFHRDDVSKCVPIPSRKEGLYIDVTGTLSLTWSVSR